MSNATKHTPGPWFVPYRSHGALYVEARLRPGWLQEVAACGPTEIPEQQEANARLIAAAPELLEALQHAKNSLVAFKFLPGERNAWEDHDEVNLEAVDAAIAKATGGAQ